MKVLIGPVLNKNCKWIVNVIVQLELLKARVQHFSHDTTETLPQNLGVKQIKWKQLKCYVLFVMYVCHCSILRQGYRPNWCIRTPYIGSPHHNFLYNQLNFLRNQIEDFINSCGTLYSKNYLTLFMTNFWSIEIIAKNIVQSKNKLAYSSHM